MLKRVQHDKFLHYLNEQTFLGFAQLGQFVSCQTFNGFIPTVIVNKAIFFMFNTQNKDCKLGLRKLKPYITRYYISF